MMIQIQRLKSSHCPQIMHNMCNMSEISIAIIQVACCIYVDYDFRIQKIPTDEEK